MVDLGGIYRIGYINITNRDGKYRKLSNIRRTKSQNLNVSRHGLELSLNNILKPSVSWWMKM